MDKLEYEIEFVKKYIDEYISLLNDTKNVSLMKNTDKYVYIETIAVRQFIVNRLRELENRLLSLEKELFDKQRNNS